MKRVVKMIIPAVICGLIFTLIGCEKNDNLEIDDSGKITVSLMERDDYAIFDKTVILYETDNYLIKTPLYHFFGSMNNLFGLDYGKFLSTIKKIVSDGQTNNLLYASSYFDANQIDYVLANFLENGLCYFHDKKDERKIEQILFEYYRNTISLAGWRKFYINNVLFLETVDSFIGYKEKKEEGEKITVSLMERDDYVVFEKTVVLYENESYLVKAPLSHFLSDMGKDYFVHRYDEHLSTLEKVISDGQKNNLLHSSSYFDKRQIDYVFAYFLEYGQCYIYDKKNKENIKQIVVEYWGYSPAPLAGAGGRRFYINNVLFLETTDWIS
jgi:hypothetical protein